MHIIKFTGLEAKVLDAEEGDGALSVIRNALKLRSAIRDSLIFATPHGNCNGTEICKMAQVLERWIVNFPTAERVPKITKSYVDSIDRLADADPNFFEYPFLNGRNIKAALQPQERYILQNLERLESCQYLQGLKKKILADYPVSEGYLTRAISLFDAFMESSGSPNIGFYSTAIKTCLAQLYRQEAFFTLMSDSVQNGSFEPQKLERILHLFQKSVDMYNALFQNELFFNEREAAIALAGLANSLKVFPQAWERGLAYYEEARKILGNQSSIMDGMLFIYRLFSAGMNAINHPRT